MIETEIKLVYEEIEGMLEGLMCPKCSVKYITEEAVINKLARAEKMIEEK
jgi:hypothetical protein